MTAAILLTLFAIAPVIQQVTPSGAQRGKAVKVVLKGEGLTSGAKIVSQIPGSVTKLIGEDFTLLVEVKPDAEVGVYPLRIVTDDGLSNLVLFSVGSLPEELESEEKHQERTAAQKLPLSATINATLEGPELDYYAIDVPAARKLVIEIDARRAGSAIDPAFEVEDAQGKVIARNDDASGCGVDSRMEVAFPKAGRYYIRVHDSKYSTQAVNFYRLKIGRWQFAEALLPLGGFGGETREIKAVGGNLPAEIPVKVTMDAAAPVTPVRLPGSASLPLLAVRYEPVTGSGASSQDRQFTKPGEKLEIPLRVQEGQPWVVEVMGRAAAATLAEPIVTVFGADGKKLAGRDDVANPNLAVPIVIPKGTQDVKIVVEELLGRAGGSYGYHVQLRQGGPDFVAAIVAPFVNVPAGGTAIVPVEIRRRGYDGPVTVSIANVPPGVKVAGGNIPSEGAAQSFNNDNAGYRTTRGMLTLTAAPDIAPQTADLKVVTVAETSAGTITREAQGPAMSVAVKGLRQNAVAANWLGMGLPFSIAKPLPVKVGLQNYLARISQGVEYPLAYKVVRREGSKPVDRVRDSQVSAVGNLRILQSDPNLRKNPDTGTLMLQTNFGSPVTKFDMLLQGDAEIEGKMRTVYAPMLEVEIVPGYEVTPESLEAWAKPGASFLVKGTVRREPTFEGGPVKVEAQELPDGVKCQPSDIGAEAREFSLACEASPKTAPGKYEIFLSSTAPDVGKKAKAEYKIAPVPLKLKVGD